MQFNCKRFVEDSSRLNGIKNDEIDYVSIDREKFTWLDYTDRDHFHDEMIVSDGSFRYNMVYGLYIV